MDSKHITTESLQGEMSGKDVRKELTERQRLIMDLVARDTQMTVNAMSEKLGVNEKTIRRDLAALKAAGLLTREGGRKQGAWIINNMEE